AAFDPTTALECDTIGQPLVFESGSKLHALHTLRDFVRAKHIFLLAPTLHAPTLARSTVPRSHAPTLSRSHAPHPMIPNPFLVVCFHWLGGLASGSFYVPYRGVKKWAWEVYWLVGGFFSWIIAPWLIASLKTNDLLQVISSAPLSSLALSYFWGA